LKSAFHHVEECKIEKHFFHNKFSALKNIGPVDYGTSNLFFLRKEDDAKTPVKQKMMQV